jgi:nicotinamidase-related amidase
MDHPALLIIDMQNDFVRENAPLRVAGVAPIIRRVRAVLDLFRARSLPVFHVVRIHRRDGSDVEIMRRELFARQPFAVQGTKGAAIIPELTPRDGEYVLCKTRMSAFMHTELDLVLRTLGVRSLVVTGIQTPNCIRTTVFDAMALNYETTLVRDAVAAGTEEIHEANVRDMANIGVGIISLADLERILDTK